MITTGFYYIAACVAIPAIVCMLEKKTTWKIWKWLPGLSQILCKHRNAVQIEQNLFKAEVAQAAAALFSK